MLVILTLLYLMNEVYFLRKLVDKKCLKYFNHLINAKNNVTMILRQNEF